jgi:hypothetical protein
MVHVSRTDLRKGSLKPEDIKKNITREEAKKPKQLDLFTVTEKKQTQK